MSTNKSKTKPSGRVKVSLNKTNLAKTKIERGFGVLDLERYLGKIKQNIQGFEEAIEKEKTEMERIEGMIQVLKNDIKNAEALEKLAS